MNATSLDVSVFSGVLIKYFVLYFVLLFLFLYGCCVSLNNFLVSEKLLLEVLVYVLMSKCLRKMYFGFFERMRFVASASDVLDVFSVFFY